MSTFKELVEQASMRAAIEASPEQCECKRTQLRARTIRGGSVQYVHQCLDCGEPVGNPQRQVGTVPKFDEEMRRTWMERRAEIRDLARTEESRRWWAHYHEYMGSQEWFELREKVLQRDGYVCRGCLVNKATEVHHLTYEHFGEEFAFQLLSLCHPCHERYHRDEEETE